MANEILVHYFSGSTLYAFRFDESNDIYNTSLATYESPLNANLANYVITLTEEDVGGGGTAIYRGTLPDSSTAGSYWVFQRIGGSPAWTDPVVWTDTWGTNLTTTDIYTQALAALVAINLDHLLYTACPGNVITGAVNDNTVIAFLAAIDGDISDYNDDTDSLEKLGERLSTATITTITTLSGSTITVVRGDTATIDIDGLGDISTRTKLWLTVKQKYSQADSASIVQILKSNPADPANDGLVVLNGSTDTTKSQGSITVDDQVAGDITIVIDDAATALLTPQACVYDIQVLRSDGTVTTLTTGDLDVNADVTRTTT